MSLINQVLRDLDRRRPEYGVESRWPGEVRSLPKTRRSRLPLVLCAIALVVAGSAVARFVVFAGQAGPSPAVAAVAAVAPELPAASATIAHAASALTVPTPPVETPAGTPPAEARLPLPTPELPLAPAEAEIARLRLTDPLAYAPEAANRSRSEQVPAAAVGKTPAPRQAQAVSEKPVTAGTAPVGSAPGAAAERPQAAPPPESPRPLPAPRIEKTEALATPAERAESAYRKAIVVLNEGRVGEALDGLRAALRTDTGHSGSRQLLAKLLLEDGRADEAIETLHEGLQTQPVQLAWAMSVARLKVERRDLGGAWRTLEHSLPAAGRNAEFQGFAAHILSRLGRHREAAEGYQRAAELAPADGRWWLGLGLALEGEKRLVEAREAFLRAQASGTLGSELAALAAQKLR